MRKPRTSTGDKEFRFFVTGTDTGAGKTEAACALLALLADGDLHPAAMKPYESGCIDRRRPADALAMKAVAQCDNLPAHVSPYRYRTPLTPGMAAAQHAGSRPGPVCTAPSPLLQTLTNESLQTNG
jgi:dethiobiotin synthetase